MRKQGPNSEQSDSFQERIKRNQLKVLKRQNPSGQIDLSRLQGSDARPIAVPRVAPPPQAPSKSGNAVAYLNGLLVVGLVGVAGFVAYLLTTADPKLSDPTTIAQAPQATERETVPQQSAAIPVPSQRPSEAAEPQASTEAASTETRSGPTPEEIVALLRDGPTEASPLIAPTSAANAPMFEFKPKLRATQKPIPTDPIYMAERGTYFQHPAVMTSGGQRIDISAIASGLEQERTEDAIGSVQRVRLNESCRMQPVGAGTKLTGVRLVSGKVPAPILGMTAESLGRYLMSQIKKITRDDKWIYRREFTPKPMRLMRSTSRQVNLFVTDTSQPLHLVLQSQASTLWNIHAADGVRISHVALISSGQSSVSLPPTASNARVEILSGSSFLKGDFIRGDEKPPECFPYPYSQPDETWMATQEANRGNTLKGNFIATFYNYSEGYNDWYTRQYRQDINRNTTIAESATYVLVGPPPAAPIPYRSLADATVSIGDVSYVLSGPDFEAKRQAFFEDMMRDVIGGGITMLRPDPVTREGY